jgi:hypothetical protein
LEKLRDKEIGSSQSALQKALMSNFFAAKRCVQACTTEASTSTMEAATSAPAVGYTVEQVRAQQNDRIFRRAVQNLHVQIIEVTGEHARTGDEACEALEKLPEKDIDRAQSERRMRIFVAAKALTSSADINLDDEEHGSLSSV